MSAPNIELIEALIILQHYHDYTGDTVTSNVLWRAISWLRGLNHQLTSQDVDKRATTFEHDVDIGFNARVINYLREYINKGHIADSEKARADRHARAYRELIDVYGAGRVTVTKWISQGILGVNELHTAVASGKVKVTSAVKCGLTYYRDLKVRLARAEVTVIANEIIGIMGKYVVKYDIAGSYRRGAAVSGDVDIVVQMSPAAFAKVSKIITSHDKALCVPSKGSQSMTVFWRRHRGPTAGGDALATHVDIIVAPAREYACALLYMTGSADFNFVMRLYAKRHGMHLDQSGLYRAAKRLTTPDEQSVFAKLNLHYVQPDARNSAESLRRLE